MKIEILPSAEELSQAAARLASEALRTAIEQRGHARFIAATGVSQFDFLKILIADQSIDWRKTEMFHLDEYIGLSEDHPASFRRFLRDRFVSRIPLGTAHWIAGDAPDPAAECDRLGALISAAPIDVAFVGVGENGHLAFNDPPADFETERPYLVVDLDQACRRQQLGEGWFPTLEDVPSQAISMSIDQIMRAGAIVCIAPETRKAQAIKNCMSGEVSNLHPASILQRHESASVFLDAESSALLTNR